MWFNKVLNVSLCCLLLLGCQENTDQPLVAEPLVSEPSIFEQLIAESSTAEQLSAEQLPVEKLVEQQASTVNVAPNPKSTAVSVALRLLDVSEREVGNSNAIELLFNSPLQAEQNFDRFVETSPKLATPVLSKDGKKLQFFGIQPQTDYTINVIAGLMAENDSSLNKASQYSVTTRAMQPVVSFKMQAGAILVPGHSENLGIYSVNVEAANLNIYRVKADKLSRFIGDFDYIANSGAYHYQNANREEMVEHIYTARIETAGKANQRHVTKFAIADKKWANESGVYFATIGKPGGFEFDAATWFSVSAIGLQIRQFPTKTYVIAQDIKTGQLLSNVQIDFLDNKSTRFSSLTTDSSGKVSINNSDRLALIVARNDQQVTVLPYQHPRFDLSDYNVAGPTHRDSQIFVYSERDIYRPGETLRLNMLQRNADGQVLPSELSVTVFKPDGSTYKSIWLKATDKKNGYYQYQLDLPKSGPMGNWQAKVNAKGNSQYSARFHFKVEDFLPDRMRLSFNGEEALNPTKLNSFNATQKLTVNVLGEYLYGAAAAGNKLQTKVSVSAWTYPFKQWPDYYVGDINGARNENFELADAQLDETGQVVTKVDKDWSDWNVPVKVRLHYSLFETGGRAINRYYDNLLWPKASFIAVKPGFDNDQSASNSGINFSLLKLNKAGKPLTTGNVKAELIREEKRYFWSYNDNNGWHYQRIEKEYVVDDRILSFVDSTPLNLSQQVEWGDYRLQLTDLTTQARTVYHFRAGQDWYNDWQNNSATIRPDRVNLALDKAAYLPGENLILRIGSPTSGSALVTIESDQVLWQQLVEIDKGESTLSLSVPKNLARHDLYISAFVVSAADNASKSITKRSFGIIPLPLNRSDRQLNVEIDTALSWIPNQQVTAKVLVKDAQGNPVTGDAKVTLSAVDAGVLSVSGYQVEDPHHFFYSQRAYQGAISDVYDQVMTPLLGDSANIRWGGDAALTRGGEQAQSEVQIVSLFSGLVSVKQGLAEIPLQLPAFDGQLNLTALVFNKAQFAKAEKTVKVASPVVMQVAMPKFMAQGDNSQIAVDLSNSTDKPLQGEFTFSVGGKLLAQKQVKNITLLPHKKQTLYFSLDAEQAIGKGEINASMALGKVVIKRHWTLPVRPTQASEYHSDKALLMPNEQMTLPNDSLSAFTDSSKKLQLSVALNPHLDAQAHWQYLADYPYTCLEQTTSKSRPFVTALHSPVSNIEAIDAQMAQQKVQDAIQRYSQLQRADGSFGLWSNHSPEQHWLTVYATDFLYDLQANGVTVPADMLDKATQRLQSYLSSRSRHRVNTWSTNPQHYDAAYRAYAAYVLAKQNSITLGPLRDIAEKDMPAAIGKLPGVHLGLAMLMTGSEQEGNALIKQALTQQRGQDYLGDYGSELRDQAMAINAILTSASVNASLQQIALKMVPDLALNMQQKQWLSTQERSAILSLAMTMKKQYTAHKWQGDLLINDNNIALQTSGEYHQNITTDNNQNQEIQASFKNTGTRAVYASFDWSGVKKQPDYDLDHGIKVTTQHFLVDKNSAIELPDNSTLQSGQLLLTRITVRSEQRVADALLVNLMPAGVELENQQLNNSLKLSDLMIEGEQVEVTANIVHQEYRDDRYVAALDLRAQQIQTLYVLSRAVNPGKYVVPAVRVESMYQPSVYGVGGSIKHIDVKALD